MNPDLHLSPRPARPDSPTSAGVRYDELADVITEEEAAVARQIPSQLPAAIHPLIQQALDAHRRDLPELLQGHADQWAAYHGGRRLGFGPSKIRLIREYLRQGIPDEELLVLLVRPADSDELE